MANRSSIIRIRKRPSGYTYKVFPEGDILAHIEANQGYYLGCVHSVIRHWVASGKPAIACSDHDFRTWTGVANWISQHVFHAGPVMAGHAQAQERVSNPAMAWLRAVTLEAMRQGYQGQELAASAIFDLCDQCGIDLPGARISHPDQGKRQVGSLMVRCFGSGQELEIDGIKVQKKTTLVYVPDRQENMEQRRYIFSC